MFVKVGTGIDCGVVSDGRIHRGALGSAGDIGHVQVAAAGRQICRCGKVDCLEAHAGGGALAREGTRLAQSGESERLATILADHGSITAREVIRAARAGDPASVRLLDQSARLLVQLSHLGNRAGVIGGASMVLDELFSARQLARWIDDGRPAALLEAAA